MKRYKLFKNLLREQIRGIKKSFIDVSIVISIIYNIGVLRSNKKKKKEKIINSYCSILLSDTKRSIPINTLNDQFLVIGMQKII